MNATREEVRVSTVLVTGASGFIGQRLVRRLAADGYRVVALSRHPLDETIPGVESVAGDFAEPRDIPELDGPIDCVVHLAGVTGNASEYDAISVNVLGTSTFLRHLVDRGVRKFVIASSIAVVGCLTEEFMPRTLPIPDDHPADTANVYGLSKFFVEEFVRYLARLEPDVDATLYRIGVVLPEDAPTADLDRIQQWWRPFCNLGSVAVQDVVDAFAFAVGRPVDDPHVRVMNLVGASSYSELPTAEAVRVSLGTRADLLDLRYFEQESNRHAGVYDIAKFRAFVGHQPRVDMTTMTIGDGGETHGNRVPR